MAIIAENKGGSFELVPSGNHVARCYSMIQIGTIEEDFKGEKKTLHKVRLTFELPNETKVFKPENGEQPFVISKEFTLSMHEKASLRKFLESWRGKGFTDEEAKSFDITALVGKPCMLNIIHSKSTNGNEYASISAVSTIPKGLTCPTQVNPTFILSFDDLGFEQKFETLPDFLKDKIKTSKEYKQKLAPEHTEVANKNDDDDLPF